MDITIPELWVALLVPYAVAFTAYCLSLRAKNKELDEENMNLNKSIHGWKEDFERIHELNKEMSSIIELQKANRASKAGARGELLPNLTDIKLYGQDIDDEMIIKRLFPEAYDWFTKKNKLDEVLKTMEESDVEEKV